MTRNPLALMSTSPIGHAARVGYAEKFLSFTVTSHQAPTTGEGREKPAGQGRKAGPGHRGMHVEATEREPDRTSTGEVTKAPCTTKSTRSDIEIEWPDDKGTVERVRQRKAKSVAWDLEKKGGKFYKRSV
ncbi:hypothetical protein ACJ73_02892 [Blastomyces percursus]|uniref:Uncharacterized protein n=1 Tax=Blastomyces percursus TaxID=1658174 RepID=A0A1J9RB36_9EURO|nr:hypothetical protein ACJ73_02892 [Blastomyces percursus]